jgi:hypothetical protein
MEEKKIKYPVGKNPNSLKNLKPCKPGENRNPHGRPTKEKSITEAVRVLLHQGRLKDLDKNYGKDELVLRALAVRWLKRALKKQMDLSMLLDRIEGKVTQPVGGDPNMPIVYNIQVGSPEIKKELLDYLSQDNVDNKNI